MLSIDFAEVAFTKQDWRQSILFYGPVTAGVLIELAHLPIIYAMYSEVNIDTTGPPVRNPATKTSRPVSWRAGGMLLLILLGGLAVRLAYLYELQEHPDFQIPMYFQVDMGFIDNSALDHAQNARAWFNLPPIEPRFERNIVWRHNPGDPQLRPPLYTFFLSALYFVLGDSQFGVRLVQMLLGLGSALLAYFLGVKLYNRGAGLLMAGFMAFYWPFIIYEANLHEPVMVICCSLLFLNAALWWRQRPGRGRAVLMGLACGIYTIASAAVILFLPVLVVWTIGVLGYRKRYHHPGAARGPATHTWSNVLSHAVLVLMAFFIPILPITVLNYQESGRFVLNSFGQGKATFCGFPVGRQYWQAARYELTYGLTHSRHSNYNLEQKRYEAWALEELLRMGVEREVTLPRANFLRAQRNDDPDWYHVYRNGPEYSEYMWEEERPVRTVEAFYRRRDAWFQAARPADFRRQVCGKNSFAPAPYHADQHQKGDTPRPEGPPLGSTAAPSAEAAGWDRFDPHLPQPTPHRLPPARSSPPPR